MRKVIAIIFSLLCVLVLTACNNGKQEETSTYYFRGENEYFAISKGSVVFSDSEELFDGGNLEVIQEDVFKDVVEYSTTFYMLRDGERKTIMSNSVVDYTEGSIHVEGDLGKMSGKNLLFGNKVEDIDELRENLWFELETTDSNGQERAYQIHLSFVE